MTSRDPRPPLVARWLLRLRPLGTRRAEVAADFDEIFAGRVAVEGVGRARRRYYGDVLSLWTWNISGSRLAADAIQDLSHGLRVFRRNPGAVAISVIGLSLAIAVSTAVFGLLNATLLRPTGVSDPYSTVRVMRAFKDGTSTSWPYADYVALRENARMPIAAAFRDDARFSVTRPAAADAGERVPLSFVDEGYLRVFGAGPLFGRMLQPLDDMPGAPAVAVASYGFWARQLARDPAAVGRPIWLNGAPVTIVGVAPREFTGFGDQPPAVWAPFASYAALYRGTPLTRTSLVNVDIVGRIPTAQTRAQAEASLGGVAAALPISDVGFGPTTGVRLDLAGSRFQGPDKALMGLAVTIVLTILGLVVLLACANVANLQLASAISRRREIGVRLALGAARGRVMRQLVTESLALGLAAGAIGFLLAIWLIPAIAALVRMPANVDLAPDARVYLFISVISIAAGIAAGLAPARHGTDGDLVTPLKGDGPRAGSGRPGRLRSTLIGVQAAVSLVLIVLAALLTRATVRATQVDIGFDAQHLIAVAPDFTMEKYDNAKARAFWMAGLERLRTAPAVQSASLVLFSPYGGGRAVTHFEHAGATYEVYTNDVLPDYFATLGLRIVRGRTFTGGELSARAPVVIISETLARYFWPGQDPVGQSMKPFDDSNDLVIGVVSDAIAYRLRDRAGAALYRPLTRFHEARALVRTAGAPEATAPALRDALQALDPRLRLEVNLPATGLRDQLEEPGIMAAMSGALAALALALAIVGIYGVTAFVTGQRTREIGVRVAVGASRSDVLRLLLRDSLRPVAIGIAAGTVAAWLAGQLLAGVLFDVGGGDPLAFGSAIAILLISTAAAVFVPARRATRIDPAFVLRQS